MIEPAFWAGRRVLVTGHTGFKGGWLSTWLVCLGSRVAGFALPPATRPSFFEQTGLAGRMECHFGDVRDAGALGRIVGDFAPELIFHLAAQPLVRASYRDPSDTVQTNVMGTVHLLEAVRRNPAVRAVVVITSDKCYEPQPGAPPHREGDPLGGSDPYSASKAGQDIVARAYGRSYLLAADPPRGLATARAGNVCGGGDWAEDRILPDAVRAVTAGRVLSVRQPAAVRPWQYVLGPLEGYLRLAQWLTEAPAAWSEAWNFGPDDADAEVTVGTLVDLFYRAWGGGEWRSLPEPGAPAESLSLRLDSAKSRGRLGWRPGLALHEGLEQSAEWYRASLDSDAPRMHDLSCRQIATYAERLAGGNA